MLDRLQRARIVYDGVVDRVETIELWPISDTTVYDVGAGVSSCLDTNRRCVPNTAYAEDGLPDTTWPPRESRYSYTGPGVSLRPRESLRGEEPKRGVGADVNTADRPNESTAAEYVDGPGVSLPLFMLRDELPKNTAGDVLRPEESCRPTPHSGIAYEAGDGVTSCDSRERGAVPKRILADDGRFDSF